MLRIVENYDRNSRADPVFNGGPWEKKIHLRWIWYCGAISGMDGIKNGYLWVVRVRNRVLYRANETTFEAKQQ